MLLVASTVAVPLPLPLLLLLMMMMVMVMDVTGFILNEVSNLNFVTIFVDDAKKCFRHVIQNTFQNLYIQRNRIKKFQCNEALIN